MFPTTFSLISFINLAAGLLLVCPHVTSTKEKMIPKIKLLTL